MKTITVNITDEKDLPIMEEILTRFGLSYQINTDYSFTAQDIEGLLKTKQPQPLPNALRNRFSVCTGQ